MANATSNNVTNNNAVAVNEDVKNVKKGPGIKARELINYAVNGVGLPVHVICPVGGNRPAGLKDLPFNIVGLSKDGVEGVDYFDGYVPSEFAPEDLHTRYMARQNPDAPALPDWIEFTGFVYEGETESGNQKIVVVAAGDFKIYRVSQGEPAPEDMYVYCESAPALVLPETAVAESALVAPVDESAGAPVGVAGQIKARGKVYRGKDGTFNLRSDGNTIPGVIADYADVGYTPPSFVCDVDIVDFVLKDAGNNQGRFDSIVADRIEQVKLGKGETLSDYPDALYAAGDFTVVGEPREDKAKKTVTLSLKSTLYPSLRIRLEATGGNGTFARSYAAGSEDGDLIRVERADGFLNGFGFLMRNAKAKNLTKQAAKRAAKAEQAVQAA